MQYTIEYEETVTRINSITIEVESEEEGDEIVEALGKNAGRYDHPDDIFFDLSNMGVKVVETCEGVEDCHYEIMGGSGMGYESEDE